MSEHQEKNVVVMNRSSRTIHTSVGEFAPNTTIEVSAKEAKSLMDYEGIIDASKFIPANASDKKAEKENVTLKTKIVELEEKIAELEAEAKGHKRGK